MTPISVLLIEDNPGDARLVEEYLKETASDLTLEHVTTLGDGLDRLALLDIDVVLLDLSLPDASGIPALVAVKERFPGLPIVILTGLKDEAMALRTMRQGAQDYLVKGRMDGPTIVRALRYAIERARATSASLPSPQPAAREVRAHLDLVKAEWAALERLLAQGAPAQAPAPAPVAPGVTLGERYALRSLLGRGSYGQAFLAWDDMLGREVVVKVLHETFLPESDAERLFVKEARLLASLEHPHVVRVYDFGFHGKAPFYVMEHAAGGSLAKLLGQGPVDVRSAVRLVDHVLQGLEYVHSHGVLHRDLKPANILLNKRLEAKIGDFGMALLEAPDATPTHFGEVPAATPAYAPPEARDDAILTPASDLYAVGAVFFELLVGEPYAQVLKRGPAAVKSRLEASIPDASSAELTRTVLRAVEKRPQRRPPSAAAFREGLRAVAV